MSDNTWAIIPTDPMVLPLEDRQLALLEVVRELCPDAHEIKIKVSDLPELYHAMSNFETVYCPLCGRDIMEWWWKIGLRVWFENGQTDFAIMTPCCWKPGNLNDLDYVWPQGFARFAGCVLNCARYELEAEDTDR